MTQFTVVRLPQNNHSHKKYKIIISNGNTRRSVNIGDNRYEDYTQHKDDERKERYIARHQSRENWGASGMGTAGFWSRWLLWNKPSLRDSVDDIERRFGITYAARLYG